MFTTRFMFTVHTATARLRAVEYYHRLLEIIRDVVEIRVDEVTYLHHLGFANAQFAEASHNIVECPELLFAFIVAGSGMRIRAFYSLFAAIAGKAQSVGCNLSGISAVDTGTNFTILRHNYCSFLFSVGHPRRGLC